MSPLSPAAFIAALVVLVTLPARLQTRDSAVVSLIAWLFIVNACECINSLLWTNNAHLRATVWCDITTKLQIGVNAAIASCTLCIAKRMELIASDRGLGMSRRGQHLVELSLCLGLPLVLMGLHFVVQQGRYDIIENIGCVPSTFNAAPAVAIVWLPRLLLYFIATIYAVLAFFHFLRYRVSFATHIRTFDPSLTPRTYFSLLSLAIAQGIWGTTVTIVSLIDDVTSIFHPWTEWSHIHLNFSRIATYPSSSLTSSTVARLLLIRLGSPIAAYLLLLCLAFAEDTFDVYKSAFAGCVERCHRCIPPSLLKRFQSLAGTQPTLIIRKQSTVDIKSDADDNRHILPRYACSSEVTLSQWEKGKKSLRGDFYYDHPVSSPRSISTSTSSSDPRIIISDEFPASRPPTPPFHLPTAPAPTQPRYGGMRVPKSPPYHKPFSSPTIYRMPARDALPRGEALSGVKVTVHVQADDIV